jgi:hypothetical protein
MLDGSMNSVSQDKSIGSAQRVATHGTQGYEGGSPMKRPTSTHGGGDDLAIKPMAIEAEETSPRYDRMTQKEILHQEMQYFDERYDFATGEFNDEIDLLEPSAEDIAAYAKYVTIASKMENEAPVIALVYIERILKKTGVLINKYNWKRILLVTLCVASKVWDDDSLENVHFPKVMADVSLAMTNKLEEIFLGLLVDFDLVVKGSEYARYYFILHTLADDLREKTKTEDERQIRRRRDEWAEYPLIKAISAEQMSNLQKKVANAEVYLKEHH